MEQSRINSLLGWVAAFLMVGISALAFIVSFEAIRGFAARSGAVSPDLAWAIPLLVDGVMIMASIVLFNRSMARESTRYPAAVLVIGAGGSLALNVAHSATSPAAIAIGLIPPVALVLSVELAMSETRRRMRRSPAPVEVPAPAPPAAVEVPVEAPESPSALVPEGGAALAPDIDTTALLEALSELEADGGVSGAKLSAALARRGLEVTERDARRVLAVLRPSRAGTDGDSPAPEPAPDEEPATAAEPMPVMEPATT